MTKRALTLALFCAVFCQHSFATTVNYDALGRVAFITYDDGKSVLYSYDAAGNRTQHVVSNAGNTAPVANDDLATLNVFQSVAMQVAVRSNDTDLNSDQLVVTSAANGSKGSVIIQGAGTAVQYTYTGPALALGASTTDVFTYVISDGNGGTDTGQVNMTIVNQN